MNLTTLQSLTIPEGIVTQIADTSGRVLWKLVTSEPGASSMVILEVEKITSDTYAGETTYTGEQFILLDIYPKTNGTVKVTYGGLTKTVTDTSGAEEPNAQQVFFGTFNGVSDAVATPASGELTIEGDYNYFKLGIYASSSKSSSSRCYCATNVMSFGTMDQIPDVCLGDILAVNTSLVSITINRNVRTIGRHALGNCTGLKNVEIENGVQTIYGDAFDACTMLTNIALPKTCSNFVVGSIGGTNPFRRCTALTNIAVDSNNEYFSAENGVLFNKSKTSSFDNLEDSSNNFSNSSFSFFNASIVCC